MKMLNSLYPNQELSNEGCFKEASEYQVMVKVVDVFGNDTNKVLKVRVK
ncbi:Type 3 restriction-modification system methylation subunit [Desulfurella amilsii]|uniref:Type 3 restriction-modification system methylation subunit n=1 Tax=Desulfurella amilsii TaxID=1562698 RepID=A0A1X4XVT2_9BACT|nr:hypothetical protein [Desulfurella amilsii]OSS41653.1 Type 3 restriction-modification system methylation subunit [Desulfurella amilsii]